MQESTDQVAVRRHRWPRGNGGNHNTPMVTTTWSSEGDWTLEVSLLVALPHSNRREGWSELPKATARWERAPRS